MKYSSRKTTKNNSSRTKLLLLVLAGVLLFGGGVFAYQSLANDDTEDDQTTGIDFGPPTEEEQQAGDEQKDAIVDDESDDESDEQAQPSNSDQNDRQDDRSSANVVIVDAGQYDDIIEVRAFISDHIQDGTCRYRFQRGNQTVNKQREARADATTTVCPTLEVDRSEFGSSGTWRVTVTYESSRTQGSQSQEFQIN